MSLNYLIFFSSFNLGRWHFFERNFFRWVRSKGLNMIKTCLKAQKCWHEYLHITNQRGPPYTRIRSWKHTLRVINQLLPLTLMPLVCWLSQYLEQTLESNWWECEERLLYELLLWRSFCSTSLLANCQPYIIWRFF